MTERIRELIRKLERERSLPEAEYAELVRDRDEEAAELLAALAAEKRKAVFGNAVYIRGLIEISSICKNYGVSLVVDVISSFLSDELSMDELGIDKLQDIIGIV